MAEIPRLTYVFFVKASSSMRITSIVRWRISG